MSNTAKIIATLLFFLFFLMIGLFAGAFVFLQLQKLPIDIISPLTLFQYQEHYSYIPAVKKSLNMGFLIAGAICLGGTFLIGSAFFKDDARALHGNARFATNAELKKAGLINNKPSLTKYPSLLVGKIGNTFLIFATQTFVILKAATRKGKGIGFVIPNLLWFRDSMLVNDPKKENWKLTAGYRTQCGQKCYLFSPDSLYSFRWNPLSYIRSGSYRVGDVQNLAQILYPVLPKADPFWPENAQTLFQGLVLYLLDTPSEPCTLPNLVNICIPADGSPLNEWIMKTVQERNKSENPLSRETVNALLSWAGNSSENTRAGILSSVLAPLNICRDPIAAAAMSGNDFDFRKVRKERITIYMGLKPRNFKRFSRMMNLFVSQLISENTDELPEDNPLLKYQCALLLDEFASLGYMEIIKEGVGYLAGYNIRPLLIFQNQSQIDDLYGKEGAKTLVSNCGLEIIYSPKTQSDANEYSEMLGYETVKSRSTSRSTSGKSSSSESASDQKRALMLPQEFKELSFEKEVISAEDVRPAIVDKILYWKDELFKGKISLPVPPVPKLDIQAVLRMSGTFKPVPLQDIETKKVTKFANEDELLEAALDVINMSLDDFEKLIEGENTNG